MLFILIFFSFLLFYIEKDEVDPSKLSLSERIKLFNNAKTSDTNILKREASKRRQTRFQTQPVTSEEVQSARCVSPDNINDKALGVPFFILFFFKTKT